VLKNDENCPTGRIDAFIISDFDPEMNTFSQAFLNTDKNGFCGQIMSSKDSAFDLLSVDKEDPLPYLPLTDMI